MSDLERRALAIWQAREMRFPRFVRRMKPDAWDRASGAWDAVLKSASEAKAAAPAPHPDMDLLP